MGKVTKKHEERKAELMDAAERLFFNQGFDNTSINQIVKTIGVSQGTFYYYFKSKDDILGAVIESQIDRFANEIIKVYKALAPNPLQKLQIVLRNLIHPEKINEGLTKPVEGDSDAKLYHRLERKVFEKFKPILIEIIDQGMEEGIFHTDFPEEITEILFMGIQRYIHIHNSSFFDEKVYIRKISALEELMERTLDLKKGSFKLKDSKIE